MRDQCSEFERFNCKFGTDTRQTDRLTEPILESLISQINNIIRDKLV